MSKHQMLKGLTMFDALLSLHAMLSGRGAAIGGTLARLATLIGLYFKARHDGAKGERAKQVQSENKARDVADDVERAVASQDIDDVKARLKKWGSK